MAEWAIPLFERPMVNRACRKLLAPVNETSIVIEHSFQIVNNWRASHNYPLNTFQVGLRKKARAVDPDALVAQRIKRLTSILFKLQRFPDMKLSQMQDIGGCRAIVKNVKLVDTLVEQYEKSDLKHPLAHKDDYVECPQDSGYRGVHLVYRYFSDKNKTAYNDLKIEMQFRSQLQHAWATAVETVGTFIGAALKSSKGREDWLRFFALMSTALAIREKRPLVPGTPTGKSLTKELRAHARQLNVVEVLRAYGIAMRTLSEPSARLKDAHYYLVALDSTAKTVTIEGFKQNEAEQASNRYLDVEKKLLGQESTNDAVLVSVDSLESLERAYPNYFADTTVFITALNEALGGEQKKAA